RSHASRTRPPYARRPPATGGTGRGPCPRGAWSGRDAGASVPDDCLHPVFGHQFQLLQLAHSPLLVGRERGGSSERLELLIVGVRWLRALDRGACSVGRVSVTSSGRMPSLTRSPGRPRAAISSLRPATSTTVTPPSRASTRPVTIVSTPTKRATSSDTGA